MPQLVPIVDIGESSTVGELPTALERCGFVELRGHGLDPEIDSGLRAAADRFFALDESHKSRFVHPDPEANRGYRARGSEALSYSLGEPSPPDLFESFNCGADDRVGASELHQPTPWPDSLVPGFREAASAYLRAMERIAARIDDLLAPALGLEPGTLRARSRRGPDTMAVIDYRPEPDGTEPTVQSQLRMGPHSDYTTFTLLNADPVPGLQIVGTDGGWVDVIPAAGSLLLNVGDVLAMFTNDRWPSTLHRVLPMHAGAAPVRRSVAYFHYPDLDVLVEPLPRFVTGDAPARYAAVTVEAHLRGKLTAPKTKQRATGTSTVGDRRVD